MKIGFRLFQKTNTKENFLPSLLNLNFVLVNLNNDAQRMLWPPDEFLRWVTAHLIYCLVLRTCDKISQAVPSNVCILEQKAKA